MATTASAVSGVLRRKGWTPLPDARRHKHEGLFVTRGSRPGQVTVTCDWDSAAESGRNTATAFVDLLEAGYVVERTADNRITVEGTR